MGKRQRKRTRRQYRVEDVVEPARSPGSSPSSTATRPSSKALPLLQSIPMYDATSDIHEPSCDWPGASYEVEVEPGSKNMSWNVVHSLNGAPGVKALLSSGEAEWAVEARCAESLYLCVATSTIYRTQITVEPGNIGAASLHLWPGVVAVKDCLLDPSETAWGIDRIPVGRGRWLVRGAPMLVEHDEYSPLVFRPHEKLDPEGRVAITPEESGQDIRFVVKARGDRIQLLSHHEPALMACWATALAMLPTVNEYKVTFDELGSPKVEGSQIGDLLVRRLIAENMPLWNDRDEWDPMLAASIFIPLQAKTGTDEEDS